MNEKPKALRLADIQERMVFMDEVGSYNSLGKETAAELRYQHVEIERLNAAVVSLRAELDTFKRQEPLFLLHCGQIDSGGEQDEWETEADSQQRVDAFARLHPNQTIKLYAVPTLAQQELTK